MTLKQWDILVRTRRWIDVSWSQSGLLCPQTDRYSILHPALSHPIQHPERPVPRAFLQLSLSRAVIWLDAYRWETPDHHVTEPETGKGCYPQTAQIQRSACSVPITRSTAQEALTHPFNLQICWDKSHCLHRTESHSSPKKWRNLIEVTQLKEEIWTQDC